MINTPYVKKDSVSNYFPVPNAVFDLKLHHIEIDIYAYLMRIEDRRTYQCLASYPTIARKLGLSVNTVRSMLPRWRNTVSSAQSARTS